ncbi:MAG: YceI family protein, partial [Hymenobacteraceae bacterium]|nr:YceI family protein [Hymenobacteraceae bacterium]MDX5395366.1 YceI family protein [Hymenobacteraceae bacterium]MDX5442448.1 YceI family protein [Hymenobacteraceae bacterium]MDX5511417.1 YceI family protein [Hymenobacteraceae bacterium]
YLAGNDKAVLKHPEKALYRSKDGSIYFKSDAPLELIEAKSAKLKGIINPAEQTYAFTVSNNSFEGFNSALQREHFNENYMESLKYPNSTFTGKIIDPVDFSQNGEYTVRAKGKLNIHGVEQERIIKSVVQVKDGEVQVHSRFSVLLQDHGIMIPKIVYQKIAEEIFVEINAVFVKS